MSGLLDHVERELVDMTLRLESLERARTRDRIDDAATQLRETQDDIAELRKIVARQNKLLARCWKAIEDLSL